MLVHQQALLVKHVLLQLQLELMLVLLKPEALMGGRRLLSVLWLRMKLLWLGVQWLTARGWWRRDVCRVRRRRCRRRRRLRLGCRRGRRQL